MISAVPATSREASLARTCSTARLASFYADVTGITPVGSAEYTEIGTPGAVLALCGTSAVQKANSGTPVGALANNSVIIEVEVEDVDAVRRRLEGWVRQWVQEPTSQPWGNRSMLFRDPDGNLVNVFTPIPGVDRNWPSQQQARQ